MNAKRLFLALVLTLTSTLTFSDANRLTPASASDHHQLNNYMLNCQGCHAPDGSGMDGKVPSMTGEVAKFLHVDGGREFLVRVPGSANSALGDQDLADLLNWMIKVFSGDEMPADFVPYTASEVGEMRKSPLAEVEIARASLVEEIEKLGFEAP